MKKILLFTLLWSTCILAQTNYYIDSEGGDDNFAGTSEATAFKTLNKVNTITFLPGDAILFKKGGTWAGTLRPLGSGSAGNRIVIGSYGNGDLPIIDAEGQVYDTDYMSAAIILFNQEYWEIRDIEVRNFEQGNPSDPIDKAGILVLGKDYGTLHDFKIENVKINKVNGTLDTRENGGIFFDIGTGKVADRLPTNFDGIHVNNCYFLDVDRGGFLNQSYWSRRDLTSSFGEENLDGTTNRWYPSYNIVVENSKFENIGGNGLVIRVADAPLVRHNLFIRNSLKTTGNASYPYNCDNALWQYNEACYTVYNDGDVDASGFDSDYMCKNTTIEYNYSHHNDWGGLLVCSNGGLTNSFNDGTVVHKNIFQDETNHMIRFSGNITNSEISENVFITDTKISEMMWYKEWGGIWPAKTEVNNNIFYNEGTTDFLTIGSTIDNSFLGNTLFGNEFDDFTDFIPSQSEDQIDLETKLELIRAIGNRSEFLVSQAENVINIMWDQGVTSSLIDVPAIANVPVKEDSYVRGGTYAANNLNGPLMEIKESSNNNAEYIREIWLKFDIEDISSISSAILHVSGNRTNNNSDFNINVREVLDDTWTEGGITWNNAPVPSSLIGSFSTPGDTGNVFQDGHINVTSYIQQQIEAGDDIVSFNLSAATSSSNAYEIITKEFVENEGTGIAAYLSIIEDSTLGVENNNLIESKYAVYPNPTQGLFTVETLNSEISNVKIFSINGSLLYNNHNISSNNLTVDVSNFKTGVYFVHVKDVKGDLSVKKIIKK